MKRKAVVIYAGRRFISKGYSHIIIEGDQEHGYARPPAKWALPGMVFDVHFGDDDSLMLGGDNAPVRIEQYDLDEVQTSRIAEWWVLDRAAEIEHGLEQKAKKARAGDNELREMLRPLREKFRRANQIQKRLLLAVVIEELMRP